MSPESLSFIRPLNLTEDYPLLCEWWKARGHAVLDQAVFPEEGAVYVANNRPVAMSFLYADRMGKLAMIEFTSTNPDPAISARSKLRGVKELFGRLEAEARERGCLCVLSMVTPNGSEEHLLSKLGWVTSPDQKPHVMAAKRLRN